MSGPAATDPAATSPRAGPVEDPPFRPELVGRFTYCGYEVAHAGSVLRLRCSYALDDLRFEELITFTTEPDDGGGASPESIDRALRLVYLLAGISYYKAAAPPVIEVDAPGLTPAERRLLEAFYLDGLGEYAYRNQLDLSGLRIEAAMRAPVTGPTGGAPTLARPLIPFGGGLDSIVTVEGVGHKVPDAALFVVSRAGDRFDAIETAAAVTGLAVVRAERQLDAKILRSRELGFRNGHVPVTGILSAIAVTAALLAGRDSVVMSNEWSASSGNVVHGGRTVNHQWSKTLTFEDLFRTAIDEALPTPVDYYSWLRPFSELWVARRFSDLDRYHLAFRSCNRAFHIDRAQRLDHWCGHCDKCCFIDLILSPFLPRERLEAIFGGNEPLANPELVEQFRTLLGLSGEIKPFECVGDVDECRVAVMLAADRPDRSPDRSPLVRSLADEVAPLIPGAIEPFVEALLRPLSEHRIPAAHAPQDLLD